MRRVLRWRYYCDFCKRSSGQTLARHEDRCTMNPNRKCHFCVLLEETQMLTTDLLAALRSGAVPILPALRAVAHDCPACILAALRQLPLEESTRLDDSVDLFDYKAEKERTFAALYAPQPEY